LGELSEAARLELPATVDFAAIGRLKEALSERLAAGQSVHLDGSQVSEPSAALIQVIEAAAVAFEARDLKVDIAAPTDDLCAAYEDLGLFGALMSRIAVEL
jgi:hypothetical protein